MSSKTQKIQTEEAKTLANIKYIIQNVTDITSDDRNHILNKIIIRSGVNRSEIFRKGNGSQVRFKDLNPQTIRDISDFIREKITSSQEKLKNLTDDMEDDSEHTTESEEAEEAEDESDTSPSSKSTTKSGSEKLSK